MNQEPADRKSNGFLYPKWLVIQLLEKCNLRCRMCYEWGENGSYFGKQSLEELDMAVVRRVLEEARDKKPYLGLFGGEPLMYTHIDEVLHLVSEFGLKLDIPTNGTFLEKYAELLVETKPQRLWISLDGPEEINDYQRGKGVFRKVVDGIDRLFQVRQDRGSSLPKIGLTIIVTPFNYRYVETLFLDCVDMSKIDHISIEFQLYATNEQYEQYKHVLAEEFGVMEAPCAKGFVWDHAEFASIDIPLLIKQINSVREYCNAHDIYMITYPKTIEENNIRNFFTANWSEMKDHRDKCSFPWLYAEINTRGDVSCCHTFYDLVCGNVYRQSLTEIWNGDRIKEIRAHVKKTLFPICTACSRYYADPARK
jgi:MoaA/NifB/PqqE/SkfB family radical SAM enzyme